jgi:large conductance mechanosensitive channel
MSLWTEYKAFLTKSNALALAVGVIIAVALWTVVASLVNDIIMPIIGYVLGGVDFSQFKIVLDSSKDPEVSINYGVFINTVITFVVVAFVAFALARILLPKPVPGPDTKTCPACGELVLATATRCKYCTSDLAAA